MAELTKKLDKSWAEKVLDEKVTLILAVVNDLKKKGEDIAADIMTGGYGSLEEFLLAHDAKQSALIDLEGESTLDGNMIYLKRCPMSGLLAETTKGGKPEHFDKIVDKWKQLYKNKGAILHPYCIVHQVIRQEIAEKTSVNGKKLRVYQVACSSADGTKMAFADEGLKKYNLTPEAAKKMIRGSACMYGVDTSYI